MSICGTSVRSLTAFDIPRQIHILFTHRLYQCAFALKNSVWNSIFVNCTQNQPSFIKMATKSPLSIQDILKSIERYNPEHLPTLESHVREQAKGNTYDLEVNLAVLKSYQFDPSLMNLEITNLILLKALTNLPHTDFTLCKCLLLPAQMDDPTISDIVDLADILEKCDFELFWSKVLSTPDMIVNVKGFFDSIRKFVCNVINITFQTISSQYLRRLLGGVDDNAFNHWIKKYGWKDQGEVILIAKQDENIKTKNITEKIAFENLSNIMSKCL